MDSSDVLNEKSKIIDENNILNKTVLISNLSEKSDLYRLEIKNETSEEHVREKRNILSPRYIPFAFQRKFGSGRDEETCIPNSSEDFPKDLFTMEQKRHGAVILHFILGIYCFTLLAVVCNDYFLPSVERICEVMNLSEVSQLNLIILNFD